jgi:hypothetical protein
MPVLDECEYCKVLGSANCLAPGRKVISDVNRGQQW